jgi:uncharacterized protein (DUF2267 family)
MRILLDDSETTITAETIGDGLEKAAFLAHQRGRLIVEVEVDGVHWTEEDLAAPESTRRTAVELKLLTAHPGELLQETFVQSADAVEKLDELQRESAHALQSGANKLGYDKLLEALSVWAAVQTALTRGLSMGVVSPESIASSGIDFDAAVKALDARLRTLKQAMSAQDVVALCDELLYEFPPVIRMFVDLLRALARAAGDSVSQSKTERTTLAGS